MTKVAIRRAIAKTTASNTSRCIANYYLNESIRRVETGPGSVHAERDPSYYDSHVGPLLVAAAEGYDAVVVNQTHEYDDLNEDINQSS